MEISKEKFNDFVDAFKTHVNESKVEFLSAEEQEEKVLQSKVEQTVSNEKKIEDRLKAATEKHTSNVLKSKETDEEKVQKSIALNESKLQQIQATKENRLQSILNDLEKEKTKLEKALSTLENRYLKDEKKSVSIIEKLEKEMNAYNVETLVNRAERSSQSQLRSIQTKLYQSLAKKLKYSDQVNDYIERLKNIQASIEILKSVYESRVQKLQHRIQKEELSYNVQTAYLEQAKIREELKIQYDLDKISTNFEYNINHEALKTEECKIDLEYRINNDREELRYYEEIQELIKNKEFKNEKDKVALETIILKDRAARVKNNFGLSNNEHKNLFSYENTLNNSKNTIANTNYKISIEEIDVRTKHLLDRIDVSISELKTNLEYIKNKVSNNLKIELTMPKEQIKIIDTKYKSDTKELDKACDDSIKEIEDKLAILDPSFDNIEIKELKDSLKELKSKHKEDSAILESEYNATILAYQNKMDYANERAEKILEESKNLFDLQMNLYNNEIKLIKANAEKEKDNAKKLLESIQSSNNKNLDFVKEMNNLAIKQNDDLVTYLVELSQSNIDSAEMRNKNKDEETQRIFDERINAKRLWMQKKESLYLKDVKELETKLNNYTLMINGKIDTEKKELEKRLNKLNLQLKNDLNKVLNKHNAILKSFDAAIKDAEAEFGKENKKLLKDEAIVLKQLETISKKDGIEVSKNDFDIYYEEIEEVVEEVIEVKEEEAIETASEPVVQTETLF